MSSIGSSPKPNFAEMVDPDFLHMVFQFGVVGWCSN